jgi:hypothetical protein
MAGSIIESIHTSEYKNVIFTQKVDTKNHILYDFCYNLTWILHDKRLVTCCDNDEIQSVIAIFLYSCLGEELFDILDDQDLSVFIFSSHSLEFRLLNGD